MTSNSPMMDRLRGSKKFSYLPPLRFRFPKKGLIRFFLTAILLFAGFKIAGSLMASSNEADSVSENEKPSRSMSEPGKTGLSAVDLKIHEQLDSTEVNALCALAPLRIKGRMDTIIAGKDSLVRHYSVDSMICATTDNLFKQYKPQYGVAAIIQPKSGRVLALVSYRHDSARVLDDHLYLRAILPAASIFKTVTAAAAIERAGYTDSTLLPVTGRNHTLYRFQLRREIDPWNELPFGEAYARSINPVFARIGMYAVGQNALREFGTRFGFNEPVPFDLPVDPSLMDIPEDTSYAMAEVASGFNRKTSLSALHGALIAAAVINDGLMPRPSIVDSIVRTNGSCLYRREPVPWKTAVTAPTAAELRLLMERVVTMGTGRKSFRTLNRCAWSSTIECGGKTGSIHVDTLGKIDWFVGYAIDRDDPVRSLAISVATVHGVLWTVHSGYIAAEVIRNYYRPLKIGVSTKQFAIPEQPKTGLSTRQLTIPVLIDSTDTVSTPEG
jgi:peptidoglycan glycosyltransferase